MLIVESAARSGMGFTNVRSKMAAVFKSSRSYADAHLLSPSPLYFFHSYSCAPAYVLQELLIPVVYGVERVISCQLGYVLVR